MSNAPFSLDSLRHAHAEALKTLAVLRLKLDGAPRGSVGSYAGLGTGSSVDFQDHRPYAPGDDPRHIDWLAYARSGHYTMKLFREEVSPRLDLVLDVSESMLITPQKEACTLGLFFFCVESALKGRAALHVYLVSGSSFTMLSHAQLQSYDLPSLVRSPRQSPELQLLPLRADASRILISDLLFADNPSSVLSVLSSTRCRSALMVPYLQEERAPTWIGNIDFIDCEGGAVQSQHVGEETMRRYAEVYARHFELWREEAQRYGAKMCRVGSGTALSSSLLGEGVKVGLVEACN